MAFSFGFDHPARIKNAAVTDDFEKEYQKFNEEQKKIKQECDAAKTVEKHKSAVTDETIAAVDAFIEATDATEQTDVTSKKKKKKVAEETVEL